MNLSLQPTASSVILTALVMAAGIWMSYIACKRNRRPLTFKLEILRLAILGFICFLLFQVRIVLDVDAAASDAGGDRLRGLRLRFGHRNRIIAPYEILSVTIP